MATRLLYKRADKKWAWRLEADSGDVIATDGSQGYENEGDARKMADAVVGTKYAGVQKKIWRA